MSLRRTVRDTCVPDIDGDEDTTVICLICYDDIDILSTSNSSRSYDLDVESGGDLSSVNSAKFYTRVSKCHHVFCNSCLYEYASQQLVTITAATCNSRYPLLCPCANSPEKCEQVISDAQIDALCQHRKEDDDNSFDSSNKNNLQHQVQRIRRLRKDPSLLTCPKCDEFTSRSSLSKKFTTNKNSGNSSSSFSSNDVACQHCKHHFCAIHGDMHSAMSCTDFQQSSKKQELEQAEQLISACTKPCSHCGSRILKYAGCDHIVCPACHQDFCFQCGTHVHLRGKVVRTCGRCRQGYVDHRHQFQYRMRLLLYLPFFLPSFAVYIAISSVCALVTLFFCCCFGCGLCFDKEKRKVTPRKAISRGLTIVFLPILVLLHEFGITLGEINEMFNSENENTNNENSDDNIFSRDFPTMSTQASNITAATEDTV